MSLRIIKTSALAAILAASAVAPAYAIEPLRPQGSSEAKAAQIDKSGLLILIRHVMHALDLANKSGNYTILREIAAPSFAAVNDAARLSQAFRGLRDLNVDLSGLLVYEPQLTVMPQMDKNGMMRFAGFFPSATNQIRFDMTFAPVNGQWKIFALAADVAPSGPIAPAPEPARPAAAQKPLAPPKPK